MVHRVSSVLTLVLIAIQATLVASSPFSGFYVGGGVGWDLFQFQDRAQNVTLPGFFPFGYGSSHSSRFIGEGFVGWTLSFGAPHLGLRVGYHGYPSSKLKLIPFPGFSPYLESFSKEQGAFLDLIPGLQLSRCLFAHLIFGVAYEKYHLFARFNFPNDHDTFRDQSRWAYSPRLGAGGQWSFCRCLTAGFEWIYNFPGNVHYPAPYFLGGELGDENQHRVKVRGNQFALTLNYYFFRRGR